MSQSEIAFFLSNDGSLILSDSPALSSQAEFTFLFFNFIRKIDFFTSFHQLTFRKLRKEILKKIFIQSPEREAAMGESMLKRFQLFIETAIKL